LALASVCVARLSIGSNWQGLCRNRQKVLKREEDMQVQKAKLTHTPKTRTEMNGKSRRAPLPGKREGSYTKETPESNGPTLVPCALQGPDGKTRPGWEMWVGDILFGRADTRESLLQYYARIHEPMPSGHWRENSWQSSPRLTRRPRRERHYHDEYEDDINLENELAGRWD
jgi:hypothetical protein